MTNEAANLERNLTKWNSDHRRQRIATANSGKHTKLSARTSTHHCPETHTKQAQCHEGEEAGKLQCQQFSNSECPSYQFGKDPRAQCGTTCQNAITAMTDNSMQSRGSETRPTNQPIATSQQDSVSDTAAFITCMSKEVWSRNSSPTIAPIQGNVCGADGTQIKLVGAIRLFITMDFRTAPG